MAHPEHRIFENGKWQKGWRDLDAPPEPAPRERSCLGEILRMVGAILLVASVFALVPSGLYWVYFVASGFFLVLFLL